MKLNDHLYLHAKFLETISSGADDTCTNAYLTNFVLYEILNEL